MSLALLLQGCATLVGSVPFKYVPSLAGGEPLNVRLGMEKLVDKHPEGDRSATESITDVDEKVTAKLLEDLRSSQMFATVDFPARNDKNDLILKGEVKRFYWKLTPNPIVFIPIINLAIYFGIPIHDAEGIANLQVQLVSSKTGKVLAEYDKTSTRTATYTLYNLKAGEAGSELADAFRDVAKQIKDAVLADGKAGRLPRRTPPATGAWQRSAAINAMAPPSGSSREASSIRRPGPTRVSGVSTPTAAGGAAAPATPAIGFPRPRPGSPKRAGNATWDRIIPRSRSIRSRSTASCGKPTNAT
jgi:hypothetical protein